MIWYRSRNTFYTLPSPRCQSVLNYPLHAVHHSWHLDTRFLVPGAKYQQDIWETNLIPAPACRELLCCKSSALLTKPRPVQIKSKQFKFGYNIPLWPPWQRWANSVLMTEYEYEYYSTFQKWPNTNTNIIRFEKGDQIRIRILFGLKKLTEYEYEYYLAWKKY